jgi:hypothetical protein
MEKLTMGDASKCSRCVRVSNTSLDSQQKTGVASVNDLMLENTALHPASASSILHAIQTLAPLHRSFPAAAGKFFN